jgi:hypothetical protein
MLPLTAKSRPRRNGFGSLSKSKRQQSCRPIAATLSTLFARTDRSTANVVERLEKNVERQFPTRVPFRPSPHRIPTLAARTERILKSHMANHLIFQFFLVRFGSARYDAPSSNPEPTTRID